MVKIRIATAFDGEAVLKIYTPHILTNAFTFETEVPSVEDFTSRIRNCLVKFPWLVCEIDNVIAGYVYASVHRDREAYQWTCECSVYLLQDFNGRGIAHELYRCLFEILKTQGLVNVYAGITLPNGASVKLHEKCGFVPFAIYDNVGYKLNAWHKVGWWKLTLNEYQLKPSPPLKFSEMNPARFDALFKHAANTISLKLNQ